MSETTDFLIVDYSQKALAIFGDTRLIKDQLKELGGRFNPKLAHEGTKKAGWIFSKSKEQELRNLLNSQITNDMKSTCKYYISATRSVCATCKIGGYCNGKCKYYEPKEQGENNKQSFNN